MSPLFKALCWVCMSYNPFSPCYMISSTYCITQPSLFKYQWINIWETKISVQCQKPLLNHRIFDLLSARQSMWRTGGIFLVVGIDCPISFPSLLSDEPRFQRVDCVELMVLSRDKRKLLTLIKMESRSEKRVLTLTNGQPQQKKQPNLKSKLRKPRSNSTSPFKWLPVIFPETPSSKFMQHSSSSSLGPLLAGLCHSC